MKIQFLLLTSLLTVTGCFDNGGMYADEGQLQEQPGGGNIIGGGGDETDNGGDGTDNGGDGTTGGCEETNSCEVSYEKLTFEVNGTDNTVEVTLNNLHSTYLAVNNEEIKELADTIPASWYFGDISFKTDADGRPYIKNGTPEYIEELYVETNGESELIRFSTPVPPFSSVYTDLDLSEKTLQFPMNLHLPKVRYNLWVNNDCSTSEDSKCHDMGTERNREIYNTHLVNMRNTLNRDSFWKFSHQYFEGAGANKSEFQNHTEAWDYVNHNLLLLSARGMDFSMRVMQKYESEGLAAWTGFPNMDTGSGRPPYYSCAISIYHERITEGYPGYRPFAADVTNSFFHEVAHCYSFSHDSGFTYGLSDAYGKDYFFANIDEQERENIGTKKVPAIVFANKKFEDNTMTVDLKIHPDFTSDTVSIDVFSVNGFNGEINFDQEFNSLSLTYTEKPTSIVYVIVRGPQSDFISTLRVEVKDWQ